MCDQVVIGVSFASDWLRAWHEFSVTITEQRKAKTEQSWIPPSVDNCSNLEKSSKWKPPHKKPLFKLKKRRKNSHGDRAPNEFRRHQEEKTGKESAFFFFWSFLSFTIIHSSGLLKYLYLVYVTTKPTRQAKVLVPITKRILQRLHRMRFPLRLVWIKPRESLVVTWIV